MSARPLKRARTGGGRVQRPIDKELIVVNQTPTTTVTATTLKTTTFPGTVVGLRWAMSAVNILTTASVLISWAIVVVQDGEAANTPSQSNGSDFYTPEQHVLAFGSMRLADLDGAAGNITHNWEGTTKTMRKLKQGDLLQFITIAGSASACNLDGIVQFFFKT